MFYFTVFLLLPKGQLSRLEGLTGSADGLGLAWRTGIQHPSTEIINLKIIDEYKFIYIFITRADFVRVQRSSAGIG
jgi:hypothetical protein